MLDKEQLAARVHTLGSSEVGAAIGVNRWMSPHTLWCLKKGLLVSEETVATRVGQKIEPIIAEMYCEDTQAELAHFGTLVHPEWSWMSATPDRAVFGARRLVEIKCVGYRSAFDWGSGPEDVPDYYRAQIAWQMLVCDADETDVAALIGGTDFRIYRINRNDALEKAILAAATRFWFDHVIANVPPPVDGSEGAREMLGKLFPRSERPDLKPATPNVEDIAGKLLALREDAAKIAAEEALLENKMREAIGDAAGFEGRDFRATWKTSKDGKRPLKVTKKERKAA